MKVKPLPVEKLRNPLKREWFDFKSTKELDPLESVIGQERAVRAVKFGLGMKSSGYNIFVTGLSGTGKATIVKQLLEQISAAEPRPGDWVFVYNFIDPDRPNAIPLSPGAACTFERDMNSFINSLSKDLPNAFNDKEYEERKKKALEEFTERKRTIGKRLENYAKRHGIVIHRSSMGYQTIPLLEGREMTTDEYNSLPDKVKEKVTDNIEKVQEKIAKTINEVGQLEAKAEENIEKMNRQVAQHVIEGKLAALLIKYGKSEEVKAHLHAVKNDIINNVGDFLNTEQEKTSILGLQIPQSKPSLTKYAVNVLVDNCNSEGAPVIVESNPTFNNLFGRIEKKAQFGALLTDHTLIKSGSLLRANGGYLILDVEGVLRHPFVWDTLKRTLQTKALRIEDIGEEYGFMTTVGLKPEPIPIDIKVIMLGNPRIFHLLEYHDETFRKAFKVRADFDSSVKMSRRVCSQYARFIAKVCDEDNLRPFNSSGVSALIEHAQRQVSDQKRASVQFGHLVSVMREASYWAEKGNSRFVTEQEIERALQELRFRSNLVEEKMQSSIKRDIITLDLTGKVVGQVNGLAVYQAGDFSFGIPSRITSNTFAGKGNVVQIDREVKMSGRTHDKGVLILSGYLNRMFSINAPLSLSASITFEQSYSFIDGDSASSTELYALLSSLSGIPINQAIAVTGSVDQRGRVQAIGGANQKIEGYFDVCLRKGLTGDQGVMIPASNVQHLMLRKDVVEVIRAGHFNIFPIKTIEQGIELLTGVPAGRRRKDGKFAPGTVYHAVEKRLRSYLKESLLYKHSIRKELGLTGKNDKEDE